MERLKKKLLFKDGTLFANSYNRVVSGQRGRYVELEKDQIEIELESKYDQELPDYISDEIFYYYWLRPVGRNEKIYWQCNKVKYADYKKGKYYIDPQLLLDFDPEVLILPFEEKARYGES